MKARVRCAASSAQLTGTRVHGGAALQAPHTPQPPITYLRLRSQASYSDLSTSRPI